MDYTILKFSGLLWLITLMLISVSAFTTLDKMQNTDIESTLINQGMISQATTEGTGNE